MRAFAQKLQRRFYANEEHPYRVFERMVDIHLHPDAVLLDAGCGRTAPVLKGFHGRASRLIGIELVEFTDALDGIETHNADLASLPLASASVDVIISRAVFEHLVDPQSVYRECARVLKPGGVLIFLTANMWDYASLIARIVPNRLHARIVRFAEGRAEEDTFPTAYRTNTRRDVARLASEAALQIESFEYLSQYPNYLMFNGMFFFVGMCFEKVISRFECLAFLRGWILVKLRKSTNQ